MRKLPESIRGFTLIELLVSISIIAILTTLLTANFIGARQRGRDGQRKANLYSIQSALELYRTDNGSYPTPDLAASPGCGDGVGLESATATVYMKTIPCDPQSHNKYDYTSDGVTYVMYACLENHEDPDALPADPNICSEGVPFMLENP